MHREPASPYLHESVSDSVPGEGGLWCLTSRVSILNCSLGGDFYGREADEGTEATRYHGSIDCVLLHRIRHCGVLELEAISHTERRGAQHLESAMAWSHLPVSLRSGIRSICGPIN